MPFAARNAFYLRVSESIVIPIYVYLDERHMQWMSDAILQHVLSDMRPHLLSKLKAEKDVLGSKKSTVDTHRGETYQFCYFLRKTEPHSLVMKSRNFRAVKSAPQKPQNVKGKRKEVPQRGSSPSARRKKPKTGDNMQQTTESDEEDWNMDEDESHPTAVPLTNDTPMGHRVPDEDLVKPVLSLAYRGFSIYGHCLCIVVEPWPTVSGTTSGRAVPSSSMNTVTDHPFVEGNVHERSKEPLFLPEEPEDNATPSGSGQYINKTYLNQVLENIGVPDDENVGGMMEFSQVLRSIGDSRAGAMNDDEDMDGSVLFGDADENKDW